MKKIIHVLVAFLTLAILGCAVLAYLWIDRSISLSYAILSLDTSESSTRHLEYLLEDAWWGMPEAQVLHKLRNVAARMPGEQVVIKGRLPGSFGSSLIQTWPYWPRPPL